MNTVRKYIIFHYFNSLVYLKYESDFPDELYYTPPGEVSCFIKSVRLKLIYNLLRAPKRKKGCDIEISKLLYSKKILCIFPLHDKEVTTRLLEKIWRYDTKPWDIPTHGNTIFMIISMMNIF